MGGSEGGGWKGREWPVSKEGVIRIPNKLQYDHHAHHK